MSRSCRFPRILAAVFAAAILCCKAGAEDVPAAVVAGSTVPLSVVNQAAADRLRRVRDDEYAIRRQALEDIAAQLLVAKEAEARGMTPDALLQAEVTDKTPVPTDAEVKGFYEENKPRMGEKPLAEVSAMIETFLRQQSSSARRAEYLRGLKARYGMTLALEVPRTDVSPSDDPSRGRKDAPVTLIEFSDYECPFCSKIEDSVKRLESLYGKSLRVVYRDFPLTIHKDAPRAAEAAACADAAGKFWPYHDLLFANQDKLSEEGLVDLAVKTGLKKEPFAKCLAGGKFTAEWRQDQADGRAAGVTGTPTIFINGRMLFGNLSFEAYEQAVDDELLRLGKPLPGVEKAPAKGKKK